MGVDTVSCGTGKWDHRIANPGPYRAYLGYGLSGGGPGLPDHSQESTLESGPCTGPGSLLRIPVFRDFVQKMVHFYTLFQKSPDTLDFGQTGYFTRTYKTFLYGFWEADLRVSWVPACGKEKKGCFGSDPR